MESASIDILVPNGPSSPPGQSFPNLGHFISSLVSPPPPPSGQDDHCSDAHSDDCDMDGEETCPRPFERTLPTWMNSGSTGWTSHPLLHIGTHGKMEIQLSSASGLAYGSVDIDISFPKLSCEVQSSSLPLIMQVRGGVGGKDRL